MLKLSGVLVLIAGLSMTSVLCPPAGAANSEEETIQACAHKRAGYLRILRPGRDCRPFEQAIELKSGEQSERDQRLYVFNRDGEAIGLHAGTTDTHDGLAYRIYLEPLDVSILVKLRDGELLPLGQSYTSQDCQGPGFYSAVWGGVVTRKFDPADSALYLAAPDVLIESAEILSRERSFGGFCGNNSADPSPNLVPAVPFDQDLKLEFPLRLPLSIGTLSP